MAGTSIPRSSSSASSEVFLRTAIRCQRQNLNAKVGRETVHFERAAPIEAEKQMTERFEEGQGAVAIGLALGLLVAGKLRNHPFEGVEVHTQVVFGRKSRNDCELGAPDSCHALQVSAERDEVLVGSSLLRSVDVELARALERVDKDGRDFVARRAVVAFVAQIVHEELGLLVKDRS